MHDPALDCEVLVVGAGPVGLATALSLVAQGVHVRVIDDRPARHATARASSIHARTLELLAPFGVADRIAAYAQPIRRSVFFDGEGQEVFVRHFGAIDSPFPAHQNLQQWHTEWIIAEQLLARGVKVEALTRCVGLSQSADGVEVYAQRDGKAEVIRCRFLVGADGARSTVRAASGSQLVGSDYPERWIAGQLDFDSSEVLTEVHALFGRERFAFALPLDSAIMFFAILKDDEFPGCSAGPANPDDVVAVYHATFGAFAHLQRTIRAVPWTGFFVMHRCRVPDYRIGRVFLAGDAAHLMSAAGGYGMNTGIQDGINLAWRLAAHIRLRADVGILDGYDVDRREILDRADAKSDAAHRMMVERDVAALGNPEMRTAHFMAAADRAVAEVDHAYTRDRMWRDEAVSGTLRAGMRVPLTADFGTGEGASRPWSGIYDGVNWVVVLAIADRKKVRTSDLRRYDLTALVWLNARVRLVVASGEAFAWNSPRPTLYLVRPDGYVAFRCDCDQDQLPDVERLTAWLIEHLGGPLLQ